MDQRGRAVGVGDGGAVEHREHAGRAFAGDEVTGGAVVQVQALTQRQVGGGGQFFRRCLYALGLDGGRARRGGRQGFQVSGDRVQVGIVQVRGAVLDHGRHFTGHGGRGVTPRLQVIDDGRLVPARQAAQRGDRPAIQVAAGEEFRFRAVAGLFVHGETARRVAAAAVAQSLYQVGAVAHLRAPAWLRLERLVGGEHEVPHAHAPAQVEREVHIGCRRRVRRWFDARLEVGIQRLDVGIVDLGVAGVRHGRIQVGAVGFHALAHRVGKLLLGVGADAVLLVGRDIGRVDDAVAAVDGQAAGKRRFAGCAVAGDAVAGAGQVGAALHQRFRWRCMRGASDQSRSEIQKLREFFHVFFHYHACTSGPGFFR